MPNPMNKGRFPLSSNRVNKEGFDRTKDNPLSFLHPNEALCAEMFVLCSGDPKTAMTMPNGKPRKWSVLQSGAYATRFREAFGYDMMPYIRKSLHDNRAWTAYVERLRNDARGASLDILKGQALAATQDFIWSRTEAKAKGDYKETRLAAADHLDRIGATEKPSEIVQNVTFYVRGRNFTEDTIDRELPETSFEVIAPPVEPDAGD